MKRYLLSLLSLFVVATGLFATAPAEVERADKAPTSQICELNMATYFLGFMYTTRQYDDDAFLLMHCSKDLVEKLHAFYDYDFEEGQYPLAGWAFRSDAQDGYDEKYLFVGVKEGVRKGWYTYYFQDGWDTVYANSIKLSFDGCDVVILDLIRDPRLQEL